MERLTLKNLPPEISDYMQEVRHGAHLSCIYQHQLCDFVESVIKSEELYIDFDQLKTYMSYQKYFPFCLFPWEKFCFTLHNCVYDVDGDPRFPKLVAIVGRGAGKNGYLSFENFCLLTDTNGIKEYNIYTFANSEDQSATSFKEIKNVLDDNEPKMKRHFRWNNEKIINTDTNSFYVFQTSNPKTKDGQRPGKIDFDEIHAYENYDLITVGRTGLGKVRNPRETIISTNGKVRGGPFDEELAKGKKTMAGERGDNGTLYFICQLDDENEVDKEECWYKANPSLQYRKDLLKTIRREYVEYAENPAANTAFPERRMNMPPKIMENAVTSWENIVACSRPIPEEKLHGMPCVAGIDLMETTDFLGAGLLYRIDGIDYWICHTWVCAKSKDLPRIKAPLQKWASQGKLTFVNDVAISPDVPVLWLKNEAAKRGSAILMWGTDKYRYGVIKKSLQELACVDETCKNLLLVRPSNEMVRVPILTDKFVRHSICWGEENEPMHWMTNNSKTIVSGSGNITYGKIEPKSRKTDTFKAFVAAECASDCLDVPAISIEADTFEPMIF